MISGKEKVSVIIPVYNVEDYLPRCLDSCLNQTLYDIEIICIDDGSKDSSGQILDDYLKLDGRIRVVHKENGGLSSARNAGLKIANGQWIMFLDSDDFLSPVACERVWVEANEAPTDIIAFGSEIFPTIPKVDKWYESTLYIGTARYRKFTPKVLFYTNGAKPFVWRQAYSKEFIDKNHLMFDEEILYGEDTVFQMTAFPLGRNFSFIADRLYNYRWVRPGSLMSENAFDFENKVEKHLIIADRVIKVWKNAGHLEKYMDDFLIWLMCFIVPDLENINDEGKKIYYANKLKEIIEKNEFTQYYKNLNLQAKKYWKEIYRIAQ